MHFVLNAALADDKWKGREARDEGVAEGAVVNRTGCAARPCAVGCNPFGVKTHHLYPEGVVFCSEGSRSAPLATAHAHPSLLVSRLSLQSRYVRAFASLVAVAETDLHRRHSRVRR